MEGEDGFLLLAKNGNALNPRANQTFFQRQVGDTLAPVEESYENQAASEDEIHGCMCSIVPKMGDALKTKTARP
jgi:hypothetical protein